MSGFLEAVQINAFVEIDRSRFPFTLPVFRDFECLEFDPSVTFFVGENGSGKSTMLEALAVKLDLPAEGGTKNHQVRTHDTHSNFHDSLMLSKKPFTSPIESFFLRAESFYNVASYLERVGATRFSGLHRVSHGEAFMSAIHKFTSNGLFLMDEPEAALSPQRQLELLGRMHMLVQRHSQLIIATHSPILLAYPGATIYEFSESGIHKTTYEETEHYWLTLDFLRNRERYLKTILDAAEGS